jgi:ABC-type multidrug transport system fused ATPase/permease subunit
MGYAKSVRKLKGSILGRSLRLLSRTDHVKLVILTVVQVLLSFLDLSGIAIIGLLGSLAVTGIESHQPAGRVASLLKVLHLHEHTLQYQATALGIGASLLLVIRTVLSVYFTRRTIFFLGRRGAAISADLVGRLFSRPLLEVQSRTTQQTIFALTSGVNTVALGIISAAAALVSDLILLVVLTSGLLVVAPVMAICLLVFFGLIGLGLYKLLHKQTHILGMQEAGLTVQTSELLMESLESYRESMVRNRRYFYVKQISAIRFAQAKMSAQLAFIPLISKYVIESSVIFGALMICGIQFIFMDARHAVGTLSIFLAASTRIAPAVLRVQTGALGIRGAYGSATPTLDLIDALEGANRLLEVSDQLSLIHTGFSGTVKVRNLEFTYPGNRETTISGVNLDIPSGATYAIVGSSGAGKTTLVDLILGVINPTSGEISISGKTPSEVIAKWPGAVSYVPQNVYISNATIRDNVALGYPALVVTDELVYEALRVAQLEVYVKSLPLALDTIAGEHGAKLSGGQRQRLGIARAVFTRPKLLIFDEATSSLDGQTEAEITSSINSLKGFTTVLIIAHRLSTVRNADVIIYMENGKIAAQGTFEEVRSQVPNFEAQAQLAGM